MTPITILPHDDEAGSQLVATYDDACGVLERHGSKSDVILAWVSSEAMWLEPDDLLGMEPAGFWVYKRNGTTPLVVKG